MVEQLYTQYAPELAMNLTDVENTLQITSTERKRWTEKQLLEVVGYRKIRTWGRSVEVPVYNREQIESITPKQIELWRYSHKKLLSAKRKVSTQKSLLTRKQNEELQQQFYKDEWVKLRQAWNSINPQLAVTFELAFFTVWASRWAKEYQLKMKKARSNQKKYEDKMNYWYGVKSKSIEHLIQSPYSRISYYEPTNPDKITTLEYCDIHFKKWMHEREMYGCSKRDFFNIRKKEIMSCSHCKATIASDYYSLFYVSIRDDQIPDYQFSFHTPYLVGKGTFLRKEDLPKVYHEEKEGLFRFGRTLFADEKIIFSEKQVQKHMSMALKAFEKEFCAV